MWFKVQHLQPQIGAREEKSLCSRDTDSCLPSSLTAVTPDCAKACVETFIANNYGTTSCTDISNLNFLCTSTTTSGLTIGEGGLQCIFSNCGVSTNYSIYSICNSIIGAQSNLAGTITATINVQSTSATSPNTISQTTSYSLQTTASITASSVIVSLTGMATQASSISKSFTSTSTSTSTSAPVATSSTTKGSARSVPPGQVAGIAIGLVVGVFLFLCFVFFICRRKRRRLRAKQPEAQKNITESTLSFMALPTAHNLSAVELPGSGSNTPGRYKSHLFQTPKAVSHRNHPTAFASPMGLDISSPFLGRSESGSSCTPNKRKSFWQTNAKHEGVGVALLPENDFYSPRGEVCDERQKHRSILPVVLSPGSLIQKASTNHIGPAESPVMNRGQITPSDDKNFKTQPYDKWPETTSLRHQQQVLSHDGWKRQKGDIEAQREDSSSSTKSSLLGAAYTAMSDFKASATTRWSIKHDTTPPIPLILGSSDRSRLITPQANTYPLTPEYDNGNFISITTPQRTSDRGGLYFPPPPSNVRRKSTFSGLSTGGSTRAERERKTNLIRSKRRDKSSRTSTIPEPGLKSFSRIQTINEGHVTDIEDDSSPDREANRQIGVTCVSPGIIPAPLVFSKTRFYDNSHQADMHPPARWAQYPSLPSPASTGYQVQQSASPESAPTKKTPKSPLACPPQDYPCISKYSALSVSNHKTHKAVNMTSPHINTSMYSPSIIVTKASPPMSNVHNITTSITTPPRGKPAFPQSPPLPSTTSSFTSTYPSLDSSTATLHPHHHPFPTTPTRTPRHANPPPRLRLYDGDGRSISNKKTPESGDSYKGPTSPEWVVTPNRTKDGDLVLLVHDL